MPNYRESKVEGQASVYTRCKEVIITNPLNAIPSVSFREEVVSILPDGSVFRAGGGVCSDSLSDPSATFDMINPMTGEILGQSNYQEVYVLLFSLYMAVATRRDTLADKAAADLKEQSEAAEAQRTLNETAYQNYLNNLNKG